MSPLEKSIAHWERLAAAKTPEEIDSEGLGRHDCALCLAYWNNGCAGCPVAQATGQNCCRGTPFVEAEEYYNDCTTEDDATPDFDPNEWAKLAQAEVDFLKGLRK